MTNIIEETNRLRREQEDLIRKSLAPTLGDIVQNAKDEIIKAKKMEIGAISTHGGVKVKKTAEGWVPVTEGGSKGSKPEEGEKPTGEPQDLGEAAKNASEAALSNAVKASSDPKVREAAHRELQRRKNEEAQETFKAPDGEGGKTEETEKSDDKKPEENNPELKKETAEKVKEDSNNHKEGEDKNPELKKEKISKEINRYFGYAIKNNEDRKFIEILNDLGNKFGLSDPLKQLSINGHKSGKTFTAELDNGKKVFYRTSWRGLSGTKYSAQLNVKFKDNPDVAFQFNTKGIKEFNDFMNDN